MTYKETYEKFWKDLVETNGVLDLDKVQRELFDFRFLMKEVPKVYMVVSGGGISHANTYAHEVVALFNEKFYEKDIVKDDMESIFKEEMSAEEKLKEIEDYFND